MTELAEYFTRCYSLVIDNTQASENAAVQAARNAVLEESPDLTPAQYRAMSSSERRTAYAAAIGANILALIEEWTDEVIDSAEASGESPIGVELIKEALVRTGGDLSWELGDHYMPEVGDADEWLMPEDEDDE